MAVAVVFDPAIVVNGSGSTRSVTSAAVSPAAGTVLVAVVAADSPSGVARTHTVSNSGTARTWVEAVRRNYTDGSVDGAATIFYALNPTALSNITVTATAVQNTTNLRAAIKVYVLSGVDASDPVGAVAEMSSTTTGAKTVTLTAETSGALGIAGAVDSVAYGFAATSPNLSGYKTFSGQTDVDGAFGYRSLTTAGQSYPLSFTTRPEAFAGHVVAAEFRAAVVAVNARITGASATTSAASPAGEPSASRAVGGATATVDVRSAPGAAKPTPAIVAGATATVALVAPAGAAGEFATIAGVTALVDVGSRGGEWLPPALFITATPDVTSTPPRVRLDVLDTRTAQAEQVRVYRVDPDGRTRLVRTSDDGPLPLSGGAGVLWDYEAPYGVAFTYTTDDPDTRTTSTVLEVDVPWLVHPGVPSRSVPVDFRVGTNATEEWGIDQGLHWPLGRTRPIPVSSGARYDAASELIVSLATAAEKGALKLLLSDGSSLLLNVPASFDVGLDTMWISVGNVRVARLSDVGSDPLRDVVMPYHQVDRPAGGTQAGVSWLTVASQHASYTAIVAAGVDSWAALAAPTD